MSNGHRAVTFNDFIPQHAMVGLLQRPPNRDWPLRDRKQLVMYSRRHTNLFSKYPNYD